MPFLSEFDSANPLLEAAAMSGRAVARARPYEEEQIPEEPVAPEQPPEIQPSPTLMRRAADTTIGGLAAVGNVLDLPGSMVRDVLTWLPGGPAPANPFDQLLSPTSDANRTTGRDLLRGYGLARRKDTWGNFLGGLVLEGVADPLSYTGIGVLTKGGKVLDHLGEMKHIKNLADDMAKAKAAGKYNAPKGLNKYGAKSSLSVNQIIDFAGNGLTGEARDVAIDAARQKYAKAYEAVYKTKDGMDEAFDKPLMSLVSFRLPGMRNPLEWATKNPGGEFDNFVKRGGELDAAEQARFAAREKAAKENYAKTGADFEHLTPEKFKEQLRAAANSPEEADHIYTLHQARADALGESLDDFIKRRYAAVQKSDTYVPMSGDKQTWHGGKRGLTRVLDDGRAIVQVFSDAQDMSTLAHETAHVFAQDLDEAQRKVLADWVGMKPEEFDAQFLRNNTGKDTASELRNAAAHEQFAQGFEYTLKTGKAPVDPKTGKPVPGLEAVFKKFKQWLKNIYSSISKMPPVGGKPMPKISEPMQQLYDEMLIPKDAREAELRAETPDVPPPDTGSPAPVAPPEPQVTAPAPQPAAAAGATDELTDVPPPDTAEVAAPEAVASDAPPPAEPAANPQVAAPSDSLSQLDDVQRDVLDHLPRGSFMQVDDLVNSRNAPMDGSTGTAVQAMHQAGILQRAYDRELTPHYGYADDPLPKWLATDKDAAKSLPSLKAINETDQALIDAASKVNPALAERLAKKTPDEIDAEAVEPAVKMMSGQAPGAMESRPQTAMITEAETQKVIKGLRARAGDFLKRMETPPANPGEWVDEFVQNGLARGLANFDKYDSSRANITTYFKKHAESAWKDRVRAETAQKRGGGQRIESLDAGDIPAAERVVDTSAPVDAQSDVSDVLDGGVAPAPSVVEKSTDVPAPDSKTIGGRYKDLKNTNKPELTNRLLELTGGDASGLGAMKKPDLIRNILLKERGEEAVSAWEQAKAAKPKAPVPATPRDRDNALEAIANAGVPINQMREIEAKIDSAKTKGELDKIVSSTNPYGLPAESMKKIDDALKEQGIPDEDISWMRKEVADSWKLKRDAVEDYNGPLRELYGQFGLKTNDVARIVGSLRKGADHDKIPGFDEMAAWMQSHYPHLVSRAGGESGVNTAEAGLKQLMVDGLKPDVDPWSKEAIDDAISRVSASGYKPTGEVEEMAGDLAHGESGDASFEFSPEQIDIPGAKPLFQEKTPLQKARSNISDFARQNLQATKELLNSLPQDKAMAAARALDAGQNIFDSLPAVRLARSLFDKDVYGAYTMEGQKVALARAQAVEQAEDDFRELSAPILERFQKSGVFDDQLVMKHLKEQNPSLKGKELYREMGKVMNERAARIRDYLEGLEGADLGKVNDTLAGVDISDLKPALDQMVEILGQEFAKDLSEGLLYKPFEDDFARYFPAFKVVFGKVAFNPSIGPVVDTLHHSMKRRDDIFRNAPGGRSVFNEMSTDARISGILHGQPSLKNKLDNDKFRDARQRIFDDYGPELGVTDKKKIAKLNGVTAWVTGLDPKYVEEQIPFFGRNPLSDFWQRVENGIRARYMAMASHELLGKAAKRVPKGDVTRESGSGPWNIGAKLMSDLKIDNAIAGRKIIEHMGHKGEYQMFEDAQLKDIMQKLAKGEDVVSERNKGVRLRMVDDDVYVVRKEESTKEVADLDEGAEAVSRADDVGEDEAVTAPVASESLHKIDRSEVADRLGLPQKYLEDFAVDEQLGKDITRIMRPFSYPEEVGRLRRVAEKLTNLFRAHMTGPFVSFHTRNFIGGQIMNVLLKATLDPYASGANRYLRPIRQAYELYNFKPGMALKNLSQEVADYHGLSDEEATQRLVREIFTKAIVGSSIGVAAEQIGGVGKSLSAISSQYPGGMSHIKPWKPIPSREDLSAMDAANLLHVSGGAGITLTRKEGKLRPELVEYTDDASLINRWGKDMAYFVEFQNRVPVYIAARKRGMSMDRAAQEVDRVHFNYNGLSQFERNTMRLAFPFYTFSSRMLGLMGNELLHNPGGRLAQSIRVLNSSRGEGTNIPDHILQTASVPIGEGEDGTKSYITGFGLPFEDPMPFGQALTGDFAGAGRNLMARLNPLIKAPLEAINQRSYFYDGPFGGRELGDLDPTLGRTVANVRQLATGEKTEGRAEPLISDTFEFAVANSPASRYATTIRTATDPRKWENPLMAGANLLTGIRVSQVSPAAQDAVLRERMARVLKDLGGRQISMPYLPERAAGRLDEEELAVANEAKKAINAAAKRAREANKARREQQEELQKALSG